jgi:hypothetical protein
VLLPDKASLAEQHRGSTVVRTVEHHGARREYKAEGVDGRDY